MTIYRSSDILLGYMDIHKIKMRKSTIRNIGTDLSGTGVSAVMMSGTMHLHSTETPHTHPFHQILVIKNGITLLEDRSRRQPLFGHMTAFLPAGLPHRSIVIGKNVEYQNIFLDQEVYEGPQNQIVIFDISDLGMSLFDRLSLEAFIDNSEGIARDCLDLFMKVIKEDINHPSLLARLPEPQNPQNKVITDYIESHFQERIRLMEINALLPLSPRQIARVFQKDLNITIFDYLKLYRIFMASTLLTGPNKNITEIAYECGYESISCFYTDFRKLYSIPPSSFRKKIRL